MRRAWLCLLPLIVACASKTDGPVPTIASVMPDPVCTAQHDVPITITGSGFSPVVDDGLTGTPQVVMPQVFLIDASGTSTEIPAANISVPDTTGTILNADIPQGLIAPTMAGQPDAVYDVRVLNPDGHDVTLAGGLTIVAPPDLVSVSPTQGAVGTTVNVTLTGTGFRPGMTVTLDANPAVVGTNVTVAADGTSATVDFDLTNVAPGTYDITVALVEGCSDTLPGAFTVYTPHDITVSTIDPPFGCTCSDTTVTITSADGGFVSTPRVSMKLHDGTGPVVEFKRVAFVDANTLTAVVPAGAAVNTDMNNLYDVTVTNPPSDGGVGVLANGFRVVMSEVPSIEAIVPARGLPSTDVPVKIYGENFRDPVKVELLDRNLVAQATVASVTPVSPTEIDTTIHTPATEDAYLVRVTDLDENTYSTFSDFIVGAVGPSGNLHDPTAAPSLITGRRMLAGTVARDDLGNTYLYAIAGDTGASGSPLATWEVSQLGKFGDLGDWHDDAGANPLPAPLHGAAAVTVPVYGASPFVPVKSYVYVVGGRDDTPAVVPDVQRAEVLRAADAPANVDAAGAATAGSLGAGTWYYKVSAVLDAGDPDNPGGETLPSDEAIVTISGSTTSVDLTWDAVTVNGTAAVSYNIYRTDAADGFSQQEHLIANVTGTTYTDSGDGAGTQAPLVPGSLGVWVAQTQKLANARWGHQAALITDPSSGDRSLWVIGGKTDNASAYIGSIEVAPIDAMGHLSAGFDATNTAAMTPRAFFSLAVEDQNNVSGFTGIARLFAIGGVTAAGANALFEQSDVTALDTNATWTLYDATGYGNHAGPMCTIVGDKLFAMGGLRMASDTTFSNIDSGGKDVPFVGGDPQTPIQSAAITLTPGRGLGVSLVGAGFIYFIGGTSDGSNALATNQQTF